MNVADLAGFDDGDRVDAEALAAKGLIRRGGTPVKVLGKGELHKKLTVVVHAFSAAAEKKIVDAGGSAERV